MKPMKKEDRARLQKAFAAVYREKEKVPVDGAWEHRVMARIRGRSPLSATETYIERFQRLVWQLVPVAALLVLLLGVAVTQLSFVPDSEIARMFAEVPSEFGLIALVQ